MNLEEQIKELMKKYRNVFKTLEEEPQEEINIAEHDLSVANENTE